MIDVRRGADRAVSGGPGIEIRHSFSSGQHYDPANTHFGLLVAHDEHVLEPRAGFEMHPHRGLEIVTWVLSGTLLHEDAAGRRLTVRHGTVAHLSAGSGIEHAERNGGPDELRFVQMWLLGGNDAPTYRVSTEPTLRLDGATLRVIRVNGSTTLPSAPFVHVYVASGTAFVGGEPVAAGDTARMTDSAGSLSGAGEVLVWTMSAAAPSR